MAFWIFRCNTDRFNLDAKLVHPDKRGIWQVNKHKKDVHAGDSAFIWQSRKRGKFSGIRAVCSIDSEPGYFDASCDVPFGTGKGELEPGPFVKITYTDSDVHVAEDRIRGALPNLSTLRRPWDGTNFDVKPDEAQVILKMIADSKSKGPAAT